MKPTVTISLRPSIFSLVITVTSVVVELACLQALYILNALVESRSLRQGKLISVRRHRFRTQLLAVFATATFVAIEVITSANSHTAFITGSNSQPCVQLAVRTGYDPESLVTDDVELSTAAEVVALSCVQIRNSTFFFRGGNYSADTGKVECEQNALYSYRANVREQHSPFGDDAVRYCGQSGCVAVILRQNQTLLVSEWFRRESSRDRNASFIVVDSNLAIPRSRLRSIAQHTQDLYEWVTVDELEVRRQTLLEAKVSTCSFESGRREVTRIRTWTLVVAILFWSLCVALFVVMNVAKKWVMYDMRNAMDWASKTLHVGNGDGEDGNRRRRLFVRLESSHGGRTLVSVVDRSCCPQEGSGNDNTAL